MGFRISWIGSDQIARDDMLARLGLTATDEIDEANEAPFSVASLPGGWTILWSNDFAFATADLCRDLSTDGRVLACSVHETVMASHAAMYDRGLDIWATYHNSQDGLFDLKAGGALPDAYAPIKEHQWAAQESEGGDQANVDHIFDIPVKTAEALCGYRYDKWRFDWGSPTFYIAKRLPDVGAQRARHSFLSRIFRR